MGIRPNRHSVTARSTTSWAATRWLQIPQTGFVAADSDVMKATASRIEARLIDRDGFVHRYVPDGDHGIRGESAFLMCSIRLVTQYAASDRVADATARGRLLALRNDLGLLSEEYDATTGHLVGNYPQAFSHLALIQVAEALTRSRSAASP